MNAGLTITEKKQADRTIVNLKDLFRQRLYEFRHGPRPEGTCGDCGAQVLPEWFAHHAKWHWEEPARNFTGV